MMGHDDLTPTTVGAFAYLARVQLGARLILAGRVVTRAADPAEAILVGAGHRLARWGVRVAEVTEPLVEPMHPLARRVAGLPALPWPKTRDGALLGPDDPRLSP